MEKITVELISRKEFTVSPKGYNQVEVDNFLDDICEEMEKMENEIMTLRQKTTTVRTEAPARTPGVTPEEENSFREILEMAKQVRDDTIRKAKEDAEAIRAKAETEASERLDGLNEEHQAMLRRPDELKASAREYREKFEALLKAQQEALDDATDLF